MASESRRLSTWMLKSPANKICSLDRRTDNIINKNRRKAIFNWAAKGLFFLRGGGGYTHSGYYKTLSPTIACDRISFETEHKLIQNIVPF